MSRTTFGRPLSRPVARFLTAILALLFTLIAACGDDSSSRKNPVPALTALSPYEAPVGDAAFTLTVTGSGFVTGSTVNWSGAARTTTFVSSTQLTAAIPAADLGSAGRVLVTIVNPSPGGGPSAALPFIIRNPVVTTLAPAGVTAGWPAFDLVVKGTGFLRGSIVQWNGANRATTYVGATQMMAAIAAEDVAKPGSVSVTVKNPVPEGGTSDAVTFFVVSAPMPGVPVPITVAPDGSPPNGPSINGGLSTLGRHAIFASKASNLVPNDTNGAWDVFVRDTCLDYSTGGLLDGCAPKTTRISLAPDGSQADGDSGSTVTAPSGSLVVSFDGRYIAFVSSATNLVPGDNNSVDDVFLRDTCLDDRLGAIAGCTPETVRVSLRDDGSQSHFPASAPAIGVDGGQVVFVSADPGIVAGDGNGVADVYLRNVCPSPVSGCTPGTQRISVAPGDADANGVSGSPAFTGRYVAFTSAATNLVAGDSNGVVDVFMRDTCLGDTHSPSCTPSTERISMAHINWDYPESSDEANGASSEPLVGLPIWRDGWEYDGRFVVYVSSATNLGRGCLDLNPMYDSNRFADVFMLDRQHGEGTCLLPQTQRISLTSTGKDILSQPSTQPGYVRWDGQMVMFVTAADDVVPGDTNGVEDVFIRGVCHGTSTCITTTTRLSVGKQGLQGNGASSAPRGNHNVTGPDWVTFLSTATNFWPGSVPHPYYGAIFRTTTH